MRLIKPKKLAKEQSGFTILELLIATTVFTFVLLGATFSIIEVGRIYIKGIVGSETQNTARSIAETLSQAIQLSNQGSNTSITPIPPYRETNPNQYAFCVNGQLYTYTLNQEQTDSDAGFVEYASDGCDLATLESLPANWATGQELLSNNMQIIAFSITQPYSTDSNLYSISFTIAYGADSSFINGNPNDGCLSFNSGGAFCDIVPFTVTVQDRL
jgi:prepilin-type N-terminal cleavage/methylation domain-containing protein